MGTHNTTDTQLILRGIELGVREKIESVFEEEIKATQDRIAERVRGELDALAVRLLAEYSVERHGADIRIIVKKVW